MIQADERPKSKETSSRSVKDEATAEIKGGERSHPSVTHVDTPPNRQTEPNLAMTMRDAYGAARSCALAITNGSHNACP